MLGVVDIQYIPNEGQKELVNTCDGPVLCIACPGSGKTTTLLNRVLHMQEVGINPSNILLTTFTEAAARDMQTKYEKMGGVGITIKTIHSFCNEVIRDYIHFKAIIMPKSFIRFYISQRVNDKDIIFYHPVKRKNVRRIYTPDTRWRNAMLMADNIDNWYDSLVLEMSNVIVREEDLRDYQAKTEGINLYPELFIEMINKYQEYKHENEVIDFDDMLVEAKKRLIEDSKILDMFQEQYRYLMIDEFQDTNRLQAEIFYILANKYRNICVVGDDDQSIYRFRCAEPGIMLNFQKSFPDCKVIKLICNYRCASNIVNISKHLIEHNKVRFPKEIKANRGTRADIKVNLYDSPIEQAESIANQIILLKNRGIKEEEIAIIYRMNNSSTPFINEFMKKKISYYCTSQIEDIHSKAIFRDIISYYIASHNMADKIDDIVKKTVLQRPLRYLKYDNYNCEFVLESMLRCCNSAKKPEEAKMHIRNIFEDLKALSNINNPKDFIDRLKLVKGSNNTYYKWLFDDYRHKHADSDDFSEIKIEWDNIYEEASQFLTFEDWFLYIKNFENEVKMKRNDKIKKGVCLTSMHSSKGLEWTYVFIVDAYDGNTPNCNATLLEDLEEERRMFYVAVTRAKDNLQISYTVGSDNHPNMPSIFIKEMGEI